MQLCNDGYFDARRRGLAHRPRACTDARRRARAAAAGRASARGRGRRRALRLPRGSVEAARGHDERRLGGRLRHARRRPTAPRARVRAMHAQGERRARASRWARSRRARRYSALDPELLLWVHATLVDTALLVHGAVGAAARRGRAVRLLRGDEDAARACSALPTEVIPRDARATSAPTWTRDARERRDLRHADTAREIARHGPAPSAAARRCARRWRWSNLVTAGLMPPRLRRDYGLAWDPARAPRCVPARANGCERIAMPLLPARLRTRPGREDRPTPVILPRDEGRGRKRHGHAASRGRWSRSCAGAGTSRSRTARWPTDERDDWAWACERAARDVADGERRAGRRLLLDRHRRLDRGQQGRRACAPRSARDAETARGARTWNDANVLALSLRTTSEAAARGDPRRLVRDRPERRPDRPRQHRARRRARRARPDR